MSFAIKMLKSLQRSGIQRNIWDNRRIALFSSISDLNIHGVIGCGPSGTKVEKGLYNKTRKVAVKTLPRHSVEEEHVKERAKKDWHENIVRIHRVEYEQEDFVAIVEKCSYNLAGLIAKWEANTPSDMKIPPNTPRVKLDIIRQIVQGVKYFHSHNLTLATLNPENILFSKRNYALCTKISTIEITNQSDQRIGWQAHEIIQRGLRTKESDLYTMGCMFHLIIVGTHPTDKRPDLISNKRKYDDIKDARHLVDCLLNVNWKERPDIEIVENHPVFWSAEKRLAFLRDMSDIVMKAGPTSTLWSDINRLRSKIAGNKIAGTTTWHTIASQANLKIYQHMTKARYYDRSMVSLLRFCRNMVSHHVELPPSPTGRWYPEKLCNFIDNAFSDFVVELYIISFSHYFSTIQSSNYYLLEKYL